MFLINYVHMPTMFLLKCLDIQSVPELVSPLMKMSKQDKQENVGG